MSLYNLNQTIHYLKVTLKKLFELLTNRWFSLADFLSLEWFGIMMLRFAKIETLK